MSCDEGKLSELLYGALDDEAAASVLSHLEGCASCGAALAELGKLDAALAALRPARRRTLRPLALALILTLTLAIALTAREVLIRSSAGPRLLWGEVTPPRGERAPGTTIPVGEPLSARRLSALALPDGSLAQASPGALFSVRGPRELVLTSGALSFHVVPGSPPFVVHTPRGDALALGTSFSVHVLEESVGTLKKVAGASVVTIVVASGVVLFRSLDAQPPETRIQAGEQAVARPGSVVVANAAETAAIAAGQSAQLAQLKAENDGLRAQLAQAKRHEQELEVALAHPADTAPAVEPPQKAPAPPALRVSFGPWTTNVAELSKIDWHEAGEAMRKLGPLIKTVVEKQAAGEDPTVEAVALAKENNKLQKLALALNGKLPTHSTGNGEFTHPVVLANLMAAALEGVSLPLTDDQARQIALIGDEYDGKWTALQGTYGATTLVLEKVLDELELKKVFCDRMDAVLTAAQTAALHDPGTRHELHLDLYSPMLMVMGNCVPVGKPAVADFEKAIVSSWLASWKVDEARRPDVERLYDAWIAAAPPRAVAASQVPFVKLDDALASGRATVVAMKDALRTLAPTADQTKAILATSKFLVARLAKE